MPLYPMPPSNESSALEPNELDRLYAELRRRPEVPKRRSGWIHERIRALTVSGMRATTAPICARGTCGVTVDGWGQYCPSCLKKAYPTLDSRRNVPTRA